MHLIYISLNFTASCQCPHLTDGETEAQKDGVTCPRPQQSRGRTPGLADPESLLSTTC